MNNKDIQLFLPLLGEWLSIPKKNPKYENPDIINETKIQWENMLTEIKPIMEINLKKPNNWIKKELAAHDSDFDKNTKLLNSTLIELQTWYIKDRKKSVDKKKTSRDKSAKSHLHSYLKEHWKISTSSKGSSSTIKSLNNKEDIEKYCKMTPNKSKSECYQNMVLDFIKGQEKSLTDEPHRKKIIKDITTFIQDKIKNNDQAVEIGKNLFQYLEKYGTKNTNLQKVIGPALAVLPLTGGLIGGPLGSLVIGFALKKSIKGGEFLYNMYSINNEKKKSWGL